MSRSGEGRVDDRRGQASRSPARWLAAGASSKREAAAPPPRAKGFLPARWLFVRGLRPLASGALSSRKPSARWPAEPRPIPDRPEGRSRAVPLLSPRDRLSFLVEGTIKQPADIAPSPLTA